MKTLYKKYAPQWLRKFVGRLLGTSVVILPWTPRYNQDRLVTVNRCDFMTDTRFMDCYNKAVTEGLGDYKIHWRAHTLCWAATHAVKLDGDFVECGVYTGFFSRVVMEYVALNDRPCQFFLMDTFEGLLDKYLTQTEKAARGGTGYSYEPTIEQVKKTFSGFKNVRIIKGPIPDTLPLVDSKKIAYLHIDMNCVMPEVAAIEYFWDKLVPGAVVVFDDYGFVGHEEQKAGLDAFAKQMNVEILSLPTGQGMLLRTPAGLSAT